VSTVNLLITGSCGFIGLNFLLEIEGDATFRSKYDKIFLIDAMLLGDHNRDEYDDFLGRNPDIRDYVYHLSYDHPEMLHETGDWGKVTKLGSLGKFDILNFASQSHVDDSINEPCNVFGANSSLVTGLVEVVGGVDNIHTFYHIRTDEEFGHLEDVSDVFDVNSPINPRNPYSASKAAQYLFLKSLETTFGLDLVCFTLANQFGPYQHESKMIPATIKRINSGESAKIYGEGKEMREWTYVTDTVRSIIDRMMVHGDANCGPSDVFISDSSGFISNLDLVEMIIFGMEKGAIEFVDNRKGHDFAYRIKSNTNTTIPFVFGLRYTIKHYGQTN